MESFKGAVRSATERAFADAVDATSLDLIIAGVPIRLRCSDTRLQEAFSAALLHHAVPSGQSCESGIPPAEIRIWSARATGIRKPHMPTEIRQRVIARRAILAPGASFEVDFDPTGRILTVMDPQEMLVDVCVNDIEHLPDWEKAAPLRSALGWILRRHDRHLIHAAAVAHSDGAALLLGRGGAGKSTASLRCRQSGMGFLGDDICAISPNGVANPQVFNIYGTAKTVWADYGRFPTLDPYLTTSRDQRPLKAVYALNRDADRDIVKQSDLRALILLDRTLPVGTIHAVDPARLVAVVASTTASFLAGSGPPMLSALSDVARRLVTVRLSVGEEPGHVAELVQAVMEESHESMGCLHEA